MCFLLTLQLAKRYMCISQGCAHRGHAFAVPNSVISKGKLRGSLNQSSKVGMRAAQAS